MFSFHATKVFNTIEGGAVAYKDENLSKILYDIKNFGITGPESVEYVGGNAKMNEFQAQSEPYCQAWSQQDLYQVQLMPSWLAE